MKEASKEKISLDCGCEAYVAFKVCRNCRGKLSRKSIQEVVSQTAINPYSNYYKNDYSKDIDLKVGEPDLLNPNSYLTIIHSTFLIVSKNGYLLSVMDYHIIYYGI